jgi:hypothetical protein
MFLHQRFIPGLAIASYMVGDEKAKQIAAQGDLRRRAHSRLDQHPAEPEPALVGGMGAAVRQEARHRAE